jgi:hypothetical protein
MRIVFSLQAFREYKITNEQIKDEVEMVGFGAEFLHISESRSSIDLPSKKVDEEN